MPVPVLITDLSQTAASNFPAGSNAPSTLDDTQRAHGAFIAQLRDGKGFTSSSTVASAATVDIGAQNALFVDVTGTTTITSFGTTYNGPRFLRFADALTLTHNSASLILPGGANITTAAGDTLVAIPKTTGVTADGWVVVAYQKLAGINASGVINIPAGNIAATTVQAALNELDSEKAKSGANSDITSLTALAAGGLPDASVLTADIADAQITPAKLSGGQSGAAPIFGVRAWARFNGTLTGTNAPAAGGNVTSITRTATGRYLVNLTTALPSTNIALSFSLDKAINSLGDGGFDSTGTFNTLTVPIKFVSGSGSDFDGNNVDHYTVMIIA